MAATLADASQEVGLDALDDSVRPGEAFSQRYILKICSNNVGIVGHFPSSFAFLINCRACFVFLIDMTGWILHDLEVPLWECFYKI